jgi:hypothetical protein
MVQHEVIEARKDGSFPFRLESVVVRRMNEKCKCRMGGCM